MSDPTAQLLFDLTFPTVVPFWAMMILLPGWSWTRRIIGSPYVVVPPLVVYTVVLTPMFSTYAEPILSAQLSGLTVVFGSTAGATAIWAHLIGFDLFVGRWMYLDSRQRGTSAWAMGPLLLVVVLLSPLGLLAYLLLRSVQDVARRSSPGRPGPRGAAVGA